MDKITLQFLYTVFLYLIQPMVFLRLLIRSSKVPAYRLRLAERYGFCKNKVVPKGILLHSVSIGETLASVPLVKALRQLYPSLPITITTMTPTGSECVKSFFGKDVYHVYLPYDLPCAMNRFLNTVRPKLVIIMETELWNNMISALYHRKIPLIIANARLSDRSEKRYGRLRKFTHLLLKKITLITVQNEEDATRFIALGIKRNQVAITGNLKFDFSITPEVVARSSMLRQQWASHRKVWIATSTHDGEETIVLQAHCKLLETFPDLLLILVPRHPERFKYACEIVQKEGLNFILRSSHGTPSIDTQVVIGDTIGELMLLYGIADLAFVGGSLVNKGGHNPLEPAAYSIPIIMGPHTSNFKDICSKLKQANGLITVIDATSIVREVSNLLNNENYRLRYGRHAVKVLQQNQGVLSKFLKLLQPYLSSRSF